MQESDPTDTAEDRIKEILKLTKKLHTKNYLDSQAKARDEENIYSWRHETNMPRHKYRKSLAKDHARTYATRHPEIVKARNLLKRELQKAKKKTNTTSKLAKYIKFLLRHKVCYWCKIPIDRDENLAIDHVKPLVSGGTNSPENLVLSCRECNSKKYKKEILDWVDEISGDD